MIKNLSLLMITRNSEALLDKSLRSVKELVSEIVIIDNHSTDKTRAIAKSFAAKVYSHKEEDLGKQRGFGLKKVSKEWVLILDADEIVSKELHQEIVSLFHSHTPKEVGYLLTFQNHFLGKPVNYGGENYKMLRLFRKDSVEIKSALVHEGFKLKKGIPGLLKNKIFHYSYRSLRQMLGKFTDYAVREAKQKIKAGDGSGYKKIFLYPIHMFWARFIKDKGYKDGFFRIPLDLGFAYMEMMTYVLVFLYSSEKPKFRNPHFVEVSRARKNKND